MSPKTKVGPSSSGAFETPSASSGELLSARGADGAAPSATTAGACAWPGPAAAKPSVASIASRETAWATGERIKKGRDAWRIVCMR